MITNDEKVNKFQNAINHYAEEQRMKIQEEVVAYKQKELEEAEAEVLTEAYHLIQNEMAQMRDTISREMAQHEMDQRRSLLKRRCAIMEEVFSHAADSLRAFTKTEKYASMLEKNAKQISNIFPTEGTIICLNSADKSYETLIANAFGKSCIFKTDDTIQIGGFRAYYEKTGLETDETLDSMLEDQREWFEKNSGLVMAQLPEERDGEHHGE